MLVHIWERRPEDQGQANFDGTPFQTPSSVQFTTPRVISGPRPLNTQPDVEPRILFQTSTIQPNQNFA